MLEVALLLRVAEVLFSGITALSLLAIAVNEMRQFHWLKRQRRPKPRRPLGEY